MGGMASALPTNTTNRGFNPVSAQSGGLV